MFTTGLQGIHDKISLEISKEKLVEGYFNRGRLFILSRWLFGYNHLLWRLLIGWKRKAMIECWVTSISLGLGLPCVCIMCQGRVPRQLHGMMPYNHWVQGSYKKQDLKIKDFSRTFQHLIILFQDHFIFIKSAFNIAMQKWVLRKQDTLWNFAHPIKLFNWNNYGTLQEIIRFAKKRKFKDF